MVRVGLCLVLVLGLATPYGYAAGSVAGQTVLATVAGPSITVFVSPSIVDLGTIGPTSCSSNSATVVRVFSNAFWKLEVETSLAQADGRLMSSGGDRTGNALFVSGGSASGALSAVSTTILTNQPPTSFPFGRTVGMTYTLCGSPANRPGNYSIPVFYVAATF